MTTTTTPQTDRPPRSRKPPPHCTPARATCGRSSRGTCGRAGSTSRSSSIVGLFAVLTDGVLAQPRQHDQHRPPVLVHPDPRDRHGDRDHRRAHRPVGRVGGRAHRRRSPPSSSSRTATRGGSACSPGSASALAGRDLAGLLGRLRRDPGVHRDPGRHAAVPRADARRCSTTSRSRRSRPSTARSPAASSTASWAATATTPSPCSSGRSPCRATRSASSAPAWPASSTSSRSSRSRCSSPASWWSAPWSCTSPGSSPTPAACRSC